MRTVKGVKVRTIHDIVRANKFTTQNWFSEENMSFWNTRLNRTVYGGRYFVTADNDFNDNSMYSIRELLDDGKIDTVQFLGYFDYLDAHKAAKIIADFMA